MSLLPTKAEQRAHQRRWHRMNEMPFSRGYTYKLLAIGAIDSVLVQAPGSKKSVRLIDGDSLDRYLEKLAAEQKKEAV